MPQLATGDLIEVHGWVMLRKVEPGRYRVTVGDYHGTPIYSFTKPRGRKVIISHYCDDVDCWLRDKPTTDHNKISRVSEPTSNSQLPTSN